MLYFTSERFIYKKKRENVGSEPYKVYRGWIINTFTYVLYFLLFEKGNEETIK